MKLLNLTGKFYAFSTVGIIIFGGIIGYEVQKYHINKQLNQQLGLEKEQLIYELRTFKSLRDTYMLNIGDRLELLPTKSDLQIDGILFDTIMYDTYAKKDLVFRQLKFTSMVDGQNYEISIFKSLVTTEELIARMGEIMLILLTGLLLSLVFVNRYLSKKIWKPFHGILNSISRFEITKPFKMPETKTKVDEFNELHVAIRDILYRNKKDYLSLKEITENSSHEIQTPLAIIKSKSELLLQSDSMSEKELTEVKSIYDATNRLSKLNQGLTLLTKIENKHFETNRTVNIASYIEELLSSFSELTEMRKLKIIKKFNFNPVLIINNDLAYTLFSNLINNAVQHNTDEGFIEIKITESEVIISNSGEPLNDDPN